MLLDGSKPFGVDISGRAFPPLAPSEELGERWPPSPVSRLPEGMEEWATPRFKFMQPIPGYKYSTVGCQGQHTIPSTHRLSALPLSNVDPLYPSYPCPSCSQYRHEDGLHTPRSHGKRGVFK